jgi:hypothetical protein
MGSTRDRPAHAGEFGALGNDMAASPFNRTGADEVTLVPKGAVGHAASVGAEVGKLIVNVVSSVCIQRRRAFRCLGDDTRQAVLFQSAPPGVEEFFCTRRVLFKGFAELMEMLAGVEEVHNLDGSPEAIGPRFQIHSAPSPRKTTRRALA